METNRMYCPDEDCRAMIATLKSICKLKNVSPYALAKESGISTSTMSYLMNGKTSPQICTILIICNTLGVTIGELFEDKRNIIAGKDLGITEQRVTQEELGKYGMYYHIGAMTKVISLDVNAVINCKSCFRLLGVVSIFRIGRKR